MLHLSQQQRLQQKLSPAQIQYLKMLQLPVIALEQRIKDELEINPLLEEGVGLEEETEQGEELTQEMEEVAAEEAPEEAGGAAEASGEEAAEIEVEIPPAPPAADLVDDPIEKEIREHQSEEYSWEEFVEEADMAGQRNWQDEEDDDREIPTPATSTLSERLIDQMRMLDLEERLFALGEEIIGNIDEDGYLHRDLRDIADDVSMATGVHYRPEEPEQLLKRIQHFDPPGIGARNLRECLLVQLEMQPNQDPAHRHAIAILTRAYDHFTKKHFDALCRELGITMDELKEAIEAIKHLNPKPGEGTITQDQNYLTPDFFVTREGEDFIITLNDRNIPPLRISRAYKDIILSKNRNGATAQAKQFIRQKLESAKWFIESIYQRRQTMMKVMQAIVHKQRPYFERGPGHLKPLIYKDIAQIINMDISTISRVVNGKYVQTDWGVHELKYFFSEGIPTASGEEVSNKEVKNLIKGIIAEEDPRNPLSDESLMKILRERGYDIARRTVAKYRETAMIPVARLRRKI